MDEQDQSKLDVLSRLSLLKGDGKKASTPEARGLVQEANAMGSRLDGEPSDPVAADEGPKARPGAPTKRTDVRARPVFMGVTVPKAERRTPCSRTWERLVHSLELNEEAGRAMADMIDLLKEVLPPDDERLNNLNDAYDGWSEDLVDVKTR
jgi:hypothetical protein